MRDLRLSFIFLFIFILCGILTLTPAKAAYSCNQNPPAPVFPKGISQVGNPYYCPSVKNPAFAFGQGPKVLFDEGHNNFSTINPSLNSPSAGTYFAFAELLRADGFVVNASKGLITAELLANYNILVLSHALPAPYNKYDAKQGRWVLNTAAFEENPVYSPNEITAIKDWVNRGGSLLINSEHRPFTGVMSSLTEVFGVKLNPSAMGGFSLSPFRKSISSHPIFRGRNFSEAIATIPQINGGAKITLKDSAKALFEYDIASMGMDISKAGYLASIQYTECKENNPNNQSICEEFNKIRERETINYSAAFNPVAAVVSYGRGRVVLFTEFSSLSSQLIDNDLDGKPDKVNPDLIDSRRIIEYGGLKSKNDLNAEIQLSQDEGIFTQILLNTMHWLAFVI